jgi:branched-chain amino acid transport system permease protein
LDCSSLFFCLSLKDSWGGKVRNRFYIIFLLLLGILFLVAPIYVGGYLLEILIIVLWLGYLGSCWNIIGGYAGQISLGHGTFVGLGAYTSTLLFSRLGVSPWIGMFLGAIVAAAIGLFFGFLCFRFQVRGAYFLLITMAMAEIFRLCFEHIDFFGATVGLFIPTIKGPTAGLLYQFEQKWPFYFIILGMTAGLLLVSFIMERSKIGFYLKAIKGDEDAARCLGVSASRYKLLAMGLSSFFIAFGGTFYAQYRMYIRPDLLMGIHFSVEIVLAPIIGGMGTLFGPILGAFLMVPLEELSRLLTDLLKHSLQMKGLIGLHLITYGVALILVVRFMPYGMLGLFQRLKERWVR